MTERTHTLTDEDVDFLAHVNWGDWSGKQRDELLASLPSRQSKDPDAGLGAQSWKLDSDGDLQIAGNWWTRVKPLGFWAKLGIDAEAVSRAQLAAPKAIKLSRWLIAGKPEGKTWLRWEQKGVQLAAEVLAIADGAG